MGLPPETSQLVETFFYSDEISRQLPGRKDFVSVKIEEGRNHMQKRLLLYDIHEVHELFKKKFPQIKIGLTKFSQLRPQNCVIAGAKGTHNVCVCVIHENLKLIMVNGTNIISYSRKDDGLIKNY